MSQPSDEQPEASKRPGRASKKGDPNGSPGLFTSRWIWLGLLVLLGAMLIYQQVQQPVGRDLSYSEFKAKVSAGDVEAVRFQDQQRLIIATPSEDALRRGQTDAPADSTPASEADTPPDSARDAAPDFEVWRVIPVKEDPELMPLLSEHDVEIKVDPEVGCEGAGIFIWILPMLLLFFVWSILLRRMGGMSGPNSPAMQFGKSRAKIYNREEGTGVTFDDVAGCDEAKAELAEIVGFLQNPKKYTRLGGKVPKGVLLVGPPGTGKTLIARAVAGEAKVPFYNLSGSDFVEMFVGVGAARVRDLFEQAQANAPCIIFVDELDAIGKQRGSSAMQGNDEREQTLNALLVEMDGFDSRSGVILISATNRPEILDAALLRAGRFDRQVVVDPPDRQGRLEILQVHTRGVVTAPDLDLHAIARQTPGFVGADLANVVNEAALLAARLDKKFVELEDFQEAIERVIAGLERKSRRINAKEQNIVAYHESGHAIVAGALDEADPVHKVSIVARGAAALGYTLQVPLDDRNLMTRNELRDRICGLLGGRAAEQIIFGDVSTGASNDLQRVTEIARRMVRDYGMSDRLGNISYADETPGALGIAAARPYSEQTAVQIDQEVHQLITELFERTVAILDKNRDLLEEMAEFLKENEVLQGEELAAMLARVVPVEPHHSFEV